MLSRRGVLIFAWLWLWPLCAWADMETKADPQAEAQYAKAEEQYKKGLALYKSEKYAEAVVAFESAYRITEAPRLLYNLGQVHRKLGHTQDAIDFFDEYLKREPNIEPERRNTVDGYIREMREQLHPKPKVELVVPSAPSAIEPPPNERRPLYKKWWFWTAIGATAVVGLTIGLAVGLRPQSPPELTNYYSPTF